MTYVRYEKKGQIALITLQAPKVKNALIQELKEELWEVVKRLEADRSIKVVLIAGSDNAFCSGGDLKAMLAPYNANNIHDSMTLSTAILEKLRALPAIVVAVVNGHAAGAGFSLALATDYIISEEQSKWVLAFKSVGLLPDLGLHYHLPRLVGEKRAMQWIFEGKTLSAQQCLDYGLINEVVGTGEAIARAEAFAKLLLSGPIHAFIQSKLLIHQLTKGILSETMREENKIQTLLRDGKEHLESIEKLRK